MSLLYTLASNKGIFLDKNRSFSFRLRRSGFSHGIAAKAVAQITSFRA